MLLVLYPRVWRRRYGAEFGAVLDEQRSSPGLLLDVVLGAIDAHLDPQVAEDGEDLLRRQMKEVVMDGGLRSRSVLLAVGLLLPVALLVTAYLNPAFGNGALGGGFAIATALATGLLVGRWWAPLSFFVAFPVWFASVGGKLSDPSELAFAAVLAIAWAAVCLVGVGIRVLIALSQGRLRNRPA